MEKIKWNFEETMKFPLGQKETFASEEEEREYEKKLWEGAIEDYKTYAEMMKKKGEPLY